MCRVGASTWAVHVTGNAVYDALGSITIGVLLGCTAVFLIQQNRSLLLGAGPLLLYVTDSQPYIAQHCYISCTLQVIFCGWTSQLWVCDVGCMVAQGVR